MRVWIVAGGLALSGCGAEMVPPPRPAAHVPVPVPSAAIPATAPPSVVAIKGLSAPRLIAQFGRPQLDMSEGTARKLQFAGPICILDAYLYPPSSGKGEATVTWLDTRQRNGSPIDQASCLAALSAQRR